MLGRLTAALAMVVAATVHAQPPAPEASAPSQATAPPAELATDATATVPRPKLVPNQRDREDWSPLAKGDPDPASIVDPIKYIPLNEDGSIWASFGGQARLRVEAWNNFNFIGDEDDVFGLLRFRAHADLHIGEPLRFFIEGKSAFTPGGRDLPGGVRTLDTDELDLQQAFFDFKMPIHDDASLTVRGGRQELLFGKQRLVSPLDWSNTRRTWDGVRGDLTIDSWTVTAFWTQFAPVQKYEFNDSDRDDKFYGLYSTGKLPWAGVSADGYLLVRDRNPIDEERYTLGGRLFGKIADTGFDYDVEGAYQCGELGAADIDAFFFSAEVGYRFAEVTTRPRLFAGFDYASGDDDPTDDDAGTFDQLFPLGHAYFGYIDAIGRRNIIAGKLGVGADLTKKLTAELTGHLFWRAETADAVYNASGAVLRAAAPGNDDRFVGSEIDLRFRYRFTHQLEALFGYSHFFAGDFIENTGPGSDIDFAYFQLEFTF